MQQQPDWLQSLLPPGGKVSLTVQHPTGINAVANQAPATLAAAPPSTINKSPGIPHPQPGTPTPQPQPVPTPNPNAIPPGTMANTQNAPQDMNAMDGLWFNPYTGRNETIPGVNNKGIITDANAFWAYYNRYKTPVLDALAQQVAKAGTFSNPIDYNGIITSDADYQTGLAGINLQRWQDALAYGDPSLYASLGLTAAQQQAIRENPNSTIQQLKRALTQQNYNANSTAAAHGAWSSGARNQDLENNALENIYNTAAAHDAAVNRLQGYDQGQRELYDKVKSDLETSGAFDSKDPEANKAIYAASHAVVQKATAGINKLLNGMSDIHSVTDARNYMHAVNAALKDYRNMLTPRQKAQLQAQQKQAQAMARAMLAAHRVKQGGTIVSGPKPKAAPTQGIAGGPHGIHRP